MQTTIRITNWARTALIFAAATALLFTATTVHAVDWIDRSIGGNTIFMAIDFVSATKGFMVGTGGKIKKTVDTGVTWTDVSSGTTQTLQDIKFLTDATTGFIVGDNGTLLKTTNAGETWAATPIAGANTGFTAISCASGSSYCYISGVTGRVYATTNGTDWVQTNKPSAIQLNEISVPGQLTAFTVGSDGTVGKTTDGASSWTNTAVSGSALWSVSFSDASTGFVVGSNKKVYRTTNGGQSWVELAVPAAIPADATFMKVNTTSNREYVKIVGTDNITLYSDDNGATWKTYPIPVGGGQQLYGLYFKSASNYLAAGSNGTILEFDGRPPTPPGAISKNPAANPSTQNKPGFSWGAATDAESWISGYRIKLDAGAYVTTEDQQAAYTWPTAIADGAHTVSVIAVDRASNESEPVTISFTIDTVGPTIPAITPTTGKPNVGITISVVPSDASSISSCTLLTNGGSAVAMTKIGATTQFTAVKTFALAGTYSLQATCADAVGNSSTGAATTMTISADAVIPPAPNPTTPSAATSFVNAQPPVVAPNNSSVATVTVTVRNANNATLAGKIVSLSSSRPSTDAIITIAATTNDLGQASFNVRSTTAGISTFTAVADGLVVGSTVVNFSTGDVPVLPGNVSAGTLIKLACPANAGANDACRAVYFVGPTSKRHAFPNSKVYFTWYENFNYVSIVTPQTMASLPLGKNIGYRPGVRMVKFVTDNSVYVVTKANVLRRVPSETIAKVLYGALWNKQIDDISDAFFGDYAFGADVQNTSTYSPDMEKINVPTPLQNF